MYVASESPFSADSIAAACSSTSSIDNHWARIERIDVKSATSTRRTNVGSEGTSRTLRNGPPTMLLNQRNDRLAFERTTRECRDAGVSVVEFVAASPGITPIP